VGAARFTPFVKGAGFRGRCAGFSARDESATGFVGRVFRIETISDQRVLNSGFDLFGWCFDRKTAPFT
jgi:hypothetical protein